MLHFDHLPFEPRRSPVAAARGIHRIQMGWWLPPEGFRGFTWVGAAARRIHMCGWLPPEGLIGFTWVVGGCRQRGSEDSHGWWLAAVRGIQRIHMGWWLPSEGFIGFAWVVAG